MPTLHDMVGRRFGQLLVISQAFSSYEGSRPTLRRNWNVLCDCGVRKVVNGSNLRRGFSQSCGCLKNRPRPDLWATDPTYDVFHQRLRRRRGRAAAHNCVDCGGQAAEWSYNHQDPDEVVTTNGAGDRVRFSAKDECYEPRCRPCHRNFDRGREPQMAVS